MAKRKCKKGIWIGSSIAVGFALLALLFWLLFLSPGWHRDGGGRYYVTGGGRAEGLYTVEGAVYCFQNGYPLTGWQQVEGGRMYFAADGIRQTGDVTIDGQTYHLDESTGFLYTGFVQKQDRSYLYDAYGFPLTGLQEVDGKTYLLASDGAVQTGWQDGVYYLPSGERASGLTQVGEDTYYFDAQGVYQTGWRILEGEDHYFLENGKMAVGWQIIEERTLYFTEAGVLAKNDVVIDGETYHFGPDGTFLHGFVNMDDATYYYDDHGSMVTGFQEIDGALYCFDEAGIMLTSCMVDDYFINAAGVAETVENLLTSGDATEYVQYMLDIFQEKFPAGKYWNHVGYSIKKGEDATQYVTDTPCNHDENGYGTCNYIYSKFCLSYHNSEYGSQCLGFCAMISDAIFGADATFTTFTDFDQVRVGDCIRLDGNLTHSLVVIEKTEDYVAVAEVNRDYQTCKIGWGRKITRAKLNSYETTYITRYPLS